MPKQINLPHGEHGVFFTDKEMKWLRVAGLGLSLTSVAAVSYGFYLSTQRPQLEQTAAYSSLTI